MKTNNLISLYVKTLPTGAPIVSEVSENEEKFCLYKEIRITSRVKELVEKLRDGHRVPYQFAAERKDAFSIWLLIQVYNKLSDMEKVNYWKEYLKRCPYPVPEFLQYK